MRNHVEITSTEPAESRGLQEIEAGGRLRMTDDVDLLLDIMPPHIREALTAESSPEQLIEIVLDLGRLPEARFTGRIATLSDEPVSREDIDYVVSRTGSFTSDNRAGIERTLHRISAIRNRMGEVVGLTCRAGRAIFGTVDIVRDVIERGDSLLLLGRPGVGKTTLLRESARIMADDFGKRVIVVDTSNEIGGDGDISHPGVGRARRMQVPSPDRQHAVMIEAVENHMPEVIVIDEIGTQAEAMAARTIAERGVQLIATAHGNTVDNLLHNPTLSDLLGGIQAVTLSDEEARRRGTQKTVLERKAPPTFEVLVEIQAKDRLAVHHDIRAVVDEFLRGKPLQPEIRVRTQDGRVEIEQEERSEEERLPEPDRTPQMKVPERSPQFPEHRALRVFTYGVNRDRLEKTIQKFRVPVFLVKDPYKADLVVTHKSHENRKPKRLREVEQKGVPLYVIRSNTMTQMEHFLHEVFDLKQQEPSGENEALHSAEEGVTEVFEKSQPVELEPQNGYLRSLQHQLAERYGLMTESKGREPYRRVVIYPL
jgi:stage III sporulation protein SpoIIIAA